MDWWQPYVGIPYDINREKGVDCWGLVHRIYRDQLGVELPKYSEISPSDLIKVVREMRAGVVSSLWVSVKEPTPFDVVVMTSFRMGRDARHQPVHVGVMVTNKSLIHVQEATLTVVERLSAPLIRNRILGFYRYDTSRLATPTV